MRSAFYEKVTELIVLFQCTFSFCELIKAEKVKVKIKTTDFCETVCSFPIVVVQYVAWTPINYYFLIFVFCSTCDRIMLTYAGTSVVLANTSIVLLL